MNYNATVKQPEPRLWVYWIIRCQAETERGHHQKITYARRLTNGRWDRNPWHAKKFKHQDQAVRVAKYLIKRQTAFYGQSEWGGCKIEVVKVILERKHSLEFPLGVLEKIAKV